ncbi:hypothetical protein BYT27DRAFT_7202918 [Phlegmacium glaucopus]|nr:hypothetical protein BYT27DRAFT_7202918 [Phlegmacium glaucopus]
MTHNNFNLNSPTWQWSQPLPTNQQLQPLSQFLSSFVLGSQVNPMPWGMQAFYGLPFWINPAYQETTQQYQDQPPSWGPSHNQRGGGHHRTGVQQPYQLTHASAGMIARDRSTRNNAGTGRASRPPSRNPSSANSYHRDRLGLSRIRRRTEDISAYQVPIMDLPVASGSNSPAVIPTVSPSAPQPSTSASAMSTSTTTAGVSNEDAETTSNTEIQEGTVANIPLQGRSKTTTIIQPRLGPIPNKPILKERSFPWQSADMISLLVPFSISSPCVVGCYMPE